MTIPKFKVGDRVECESRASNSIYPRWSYENDNGSSGEYIQGSITYVWPGSVDVKFDNGVTWSWGTSEPKDIWDNPGYLRHINTQDAYQKTTGKLRLVDKGGYYGMEEVK